MSAGGRITEGGGGGPISCIFYKTCIHLNVSRLQQGVPN